MNRIVTGVLAGFLATFPMSVVLLAGRRRIEPPPAPKEISDEIQDRAGIGDELHEEQRRVAAVAGHFAYGAAAGGVYGLMPGERAGAPVLRGSVYGLGVWAASYAGWLPATRILPFPTNRPARWNTRLLLAHLVWGAALGYLVERGSPRNRRRHLRESE